MDIVEELEELKPILQEKWLDFYSKNKDLLRQYFIWSNSTTFEDKVVFTILLNIEPKFLEKMNNLAKISKYFRISSPDIDYLLERLDITCDTTILDKKLEEKMKNQFIEPPSPLDEFRSKNV